MFECSIVAAKFTNNSHHKALLNRVPDVKVVIIGKCAI